MLDGLAGTDALLETAQLVALAALTGLCALFMYKYLPETKGRSLEEMLGYFQQIANTQGGPDATQASAQSNRPTCLRFQRARVLAAADLCACATQACWTARRRSLALGSSSRTRRPSHRKSPWRRRPEHNKLDAVHKLDAAHKSWRGPGSGAGKSRRRPRWCRCKSLAPGDGRIAQARLLSISATVHLSKMFAFW